MSLLTKLLDVIITIYVSNRKYAERLKLVKQGVLGFPPHPLAPSPPSGERGEGLLIYWAGEGGRGAGVEGGGFGVHLGDQQGVNMP